MTERPPRYFVFDVESIGLAGEGFAVGYTLVDRSGKSILDGLMHCDPALASGTDEGRTWVAENCPTLMGPQMVGPREVRDTFWAVLQVARDLGALIFADCAWPVEARFLRDCVNDDPTREFNGPYPLHDVASVMLAAGMDPLTTYPRVEGETAHNPVGDARQSARLLLAALDILEGARK